MFDLRHRKYMKLDNRDSARHCGLAGVHGYTPKLRVKPLSTKLRHSDPTEA